MLLAKNEHVVDVFAADVVKGQSVIRMEYLPDGSVESRYSGAAVPVQTAIQIVEDACRGVQHLHTQGLLHRDIKPANLLFDAFGRVKVSDFGLSGMANDPETLPNMGYLKLLPPEAWTSGSFIDTVAGDIYALGGTAYRLLNGDEMMHSSIPGDGNIGQATQMGTFPNRKLWQPYVHLRLRKAIISAMNVDPRRRPGTATLLRNTLEKARPVVSWAEHPGVPDRWIGRGPNQTHWDAAIEGVHTEFSFTVRRGKNELALREVRGDRIKTSNIQDALKHAGRVLQRIAQDGV
ncbi:serine/threonine protein kinase [Arthrobacter sp. UYEF3]